VPTPPALEQHLGLQRYATRSDGIQGRLRTTPQDFVVEEIPKPPAKAQGEGKYTIATLRATNWETNRLVREMGKRLGVSRRAIFFTGTKDKRAVKTQQMAIAAPESKVRALQLSGVEVLDTFRADRAPKLGDLVGNRFAIAVRGCALRGPALEERCAALDAELAEAGGVPNYFGLQRFGALRPITQVVGERIVRGDLEGAVMAYVGMPMEGEPQEAFHARSRIQETRDFSKAVTYYPQQLSFERVLVEHLAKNPGDWTGAIRRLPQNLATMFVYAYQSLLFNRIVSERLAMGPLDQVLVGDILLPVDEHGVPDHDILIPVREANLAKCQRQASKGRAAPTALVVGLDVPFAEGPMGAIEQRVFAAEALDRRAFAVPDMPELASFGQRRAIVIRARDVARTTEDDAATFRFQLPKGSYATCVLREYLKADASAY
jgi:tRNA pseudouridine13 synthase